MPDLRAATGRAGGHGETDAPSILYLGSHHATTRWWALGVPLFVSVRVLRERQRLPRIVLPVAA